MVWPLDNSIKCYRIPDDNQAVDPLTYVLLFPFGTAGWNSAAKHSARHRTATYQRVPSIQFYGHRLMVRDKDAVLPHRTGMLFQQYVVDAYCRAEAQRLNFLRFNQAALRADTYDERQRAVDNAGPGKVEKVVVVSVWKVIFS